MSALGKFDSITVNNQNLSRCRICFEGQYWIDPNEGPPDDAVEVYCDFTLSASCIYPNKSKVTLTVIISMGNQMVTSEIRK